MQSYIHIHIYIHIHMYIFICTCTYTYTVIYTHMYIQFIYTFIYTYTLICTYELIYTYIHMYKYMLVITDLFFLCAHSCPWVIIPCLPNTIQPHSTHPSSCSLESSSVMVLSHSQFPSCLIAHPEDAGCFGVWAGPSLMSLF